MDKLLKKIAASAKSRSAEIMSLDAYLEKCKNDKTTYSSSAERLLKAIGEPEIIDCSKDHRLSVIFGGRKIRKYKAFSDFYGIEDDIDAIVSFLKHAAQGLEEAKQILFLLGDVGSGKSSFVDRLKELMMAEPIYVLADSAGNISPCNDNPLGLFLKEKKLLKDEYGIADRYFPRVLSPWALKRLREYEYDLTKFKVVKVYPDLDHQLAVAKTEPLDDNNADISTLIGKVNVRQLQYFSQNDADAYSYSGGLCRGNRGLLEMAEMYKANIKTLNPLLEASQSHSFNGLEQIGTMPFDGLIVSHSNKSEWHKFISDPKNEAMRDRIYLIKFHYSLRWEEDSMILRKMINNSDLVNSPCVSETYDMLAKWNVLTRLEDDKVPNIYSKLRVYNGENIKNEDNRALPYDDYKKNASQDEGLFGSSTRKAFKILSKTFNDHVEEVSADPVTLLKVLREQIVKDELGDDVQKKYLAFIDEFIEPKYVEDLGKQLQRAYLESYGEYAQAKFDRYVVLAEAWVHHQDYPDPATGILMDSEYIHKELSSMEKAAAIGDHKDFRHEIVLYVLGQRVKGIEVKWSSYKKLAEVLEKAVFKTMQELLPIISFGVKHSSDEEDTHKRFVDNMMALGYTEKQVKTVVDYYIRKQNS